MNYSNCLKKYNSTNFLAISFCIILFLTLEIQADVFSLIPFRGNLNNSGEALSNILNGVSLKSEKVEINGIPFQLKTKLIETDLQTSITYLCKSFKGLTLRSSTDSVLVELKHKNGDLERLYLVSMPGGLYPVISFSMLFPDGLPKNDGFWFSEFPRPSLAKIETTIYFPMRQVSYGVFESERDKESISEEVNDILINSSWKKFTDGVYVNENTMEILLVNYSDKQDSGSRTYFIKQPFKK